MGLPYLAELPARGPAAGLIGRTATQLVGLAVDLHPSGWRVTDRPGRDAARGTGWWRDDLDVLAEVYDGYRGRFKVHLAGPWTLAAGVNLPRGEPVLSDRGATRDLGQSLAESAGAALSRIAALLPGVELVLQVDEPSLPAVLSGGVPSASGYRRVPAVDPGLVEAGLRDVLDAAPGETVVHCCADAPPIRLLRAAGAGGLSVDTSRLTPHGWESVAVAVEDGTTLFAGCLPTSSPAGPDAAAAASDLAARWHRLGLEPRSLAGVVVTPACGLAHASPARARDIQHACAEVARRLLSVAHGDEPTAR